MLDTIASSLFAVFVAEESVSSSQQDSRQKSRICR